MRRSDLAPVGHASSTRSRGRDRRSTWPTHRRHDSPRRTARIAHTGLPTPDVLICAEDIQRGKPDPEGYLMAAHQLGVLPTKCVAVEDAPAGIQAAAAAGMRSIAVASTFDCATLSGATACIASLDKLDVISGSAADGITLLAQAR